jgi:hypothetical protein
MGSAISQRTDGTLYVVSGASRSGKTSWIAQRVAAAPRLLVWDTVGEWAEKFHCKPRWSFEYLARDVIPGAPAQRIAFQPMMGPDSPTMAEQFGGFCRMAYVAMRAHRRLTLVVEELADVTSPGKAPPAWGVICRRGLRFGPEIYGVTQRPSESDKTIMGNASVFHCHSMARADDARYMAKEMRIDQAAIDALEPLQFIERDRRTGTVRAGDLRRARRKA